MSTRNQYIETLRILAAFGVVWFHAKAPGGHFALSGLYFFILVSCFFTAQQTRNARKLAKTLLVPWAGFWLLYMASDLIRGEGVPAHDNGLAYVVLYGPSAHLWFLPFLFGALVVVGLLRNRVSHKALYLMALVVSVTGLAILPTLNKIALDASPPYGQWLIATVPVALGVLAGTFEKYRSGHAAMIVVGGIMLMTAIDSNATTLAQGYLLAFIGLFSALALQTVQPLRVDLTPVSREMLWVYLLHPAAFFVCRPLFGDAGISLAIAGFALSLLVVVAVRVAIGMPRYQMSMTHRPRSR